MVEYRIGNVFASRAEVLVNPVNCAGAMGKGLALRFKWVFPGNYTEYVSTCKKGLLKPGGILCCVDRYTSQRRDVIIINAATKNHWMNKSEYKYIEDILKNIHKETIQCKWRSIAMPKIGCGLGGLDWEVVKKMIHSEFDDAEFIVELWSIKE